MASKVEWRYDRLTWPEINAVLSRDVLPVVAIPIGAVEDHGLHLPLSTDNDIIETMLSECGRRAAGDLLVLPTIPFGLDEHHMDFPGAISIDIDTCIDYLSQTAISVARHGFTHILIVNGHGSNISICDLAARKCVLATGAICASTTVNPAVDPTLVRDVILDGRRGGPCSAGHAGEVETSLMLRFFPEYVQMDKAQRDVGEPELKYFSLDYLETRSAYVWQDWWSRFSRDGVHGDATVATKSFGAELFEVTVSRFVELVREFSTIPVRDRVDRHDKTKGVGGERKTSAKRS